MNLIKKIKKLLGIEEDKELQEIMKKVEKQMNLEQEADLRYCETCNLWKDKKRVRYLQPNSKGYLCDTCYHRMWKQLTNKKYD